MQFAKIQSMFLVIIIYGCASPTPYMQYGDLRYGGLISEGYTDEKIGEKEYEITFEANPYTSKELITKYWNRRAEELCGSANFQAEMEVVERFRKTGRNSDVRYVVARGKARCL